MLFGNLDVYNAQKARAMSRSLDRLARGDFGPIADEILTRYPNTELEVRAIPFVQRYVAELGGLYARPPVRRFRAPVGVATEVWQKLQAVYDASRVDAVMVGAEAALWTQNAFIGMVAPGADIGEVTLHTFKPWQIEEIAIDDPMRATDPRAWSRVVLSVPTSALLDQVVFGQLELTRTAAWRHIGGKKVGVYAADGSHPFGVVPLIVAARVEADPGRALPPVNEAVLNLQVALSLQQADSELIVRHCAWPQKVIEGADIGQLVEELQVGPDKITALIRSGDPQAPAPTMRVVQGQVPVSELVSFAEHQIRLYCAMLGLDPSTFLRVNTSVTASARLFAAQDRQAQRDRIIPVLLEVEAQLLRWVVRVVALREPMPVPAGIVVDVTYSPAEAVPDRQAAAQALQAEVALGIASPVDVVASRDGIGRSEAMRKVKQNLADAETLGLREPASPPPDDTMPEPDAMPPPEPVTA